MAFSTTCTFVVLHVACFIALHSAGWSITSQRSSVSAESDRCRCRCKFYKVKVDFRVPYYRVSCNCSTNPTCQSFVCEPEFDQLHRDIFTDNLADISASKHRATVVLERHRVGKALKKATGQGTGDGRSIGTTTVDVRTNSESPTTGLVSEELDKPLGQATYNRSARLPFVKQVMLSQCQCNCETSHGAGDFTSACYCYQSADSHGRCELRRWSCAKQTVKYTHGGKTLEQLEKESGIYGPDTLHAATSAVGIVLVSNCPLLLLMLMLCENAAFAFVGAAI